jgi:hypothetical protein
MSFIDVLNESSVTFVPDLGKFWPHIDGAGFEAMSPTGEIQAFATQREANNWRMIEVRYVAGLERPSSPTCPIHGAGCEAWA